MRAIAVHPSVRQVRLVDPPAGTKSVVRLAG